MKAEWLSDLPPDWDVRRISWLGRIVGGGTPSKGEASYWDGEIPWASPKDMKRRVITDTEDHISRSAVANSSTAVVPPGTVLIVTRSGILRHSLPVALAGAEMALNQDLKALIPADDVDSGYIAYWMEAHNGLLLSIWRKEGTTVESIETDLIKQTPVPLPPSDTQRAIVSFLDRETSKIDTLIEKKQRLLELLEEKRTALITRAVTRGLDPDVPMKDSGVEWIGEIPKHWEIVRNAALFFQVDERGFPDLPLLQVSINSGVAIRQFSAEHIEQQAADWSTYKKARQGDITFNKMRMWQGAVGSAPVDGLVSPDYTVARPREGVVSDYFATLFRTSRFLTEVNKHSHGIVDDRNRLYWDGFKQISVPVPPAREQRAIRDRIEEIELGSDRIRTAVRNASDLLREYRTARISAAVTGKGVIRNGASVRNE